MPSTIGGFIKTDLTERLRTGQGVPKALTLQALSHHYRVSLTPVREAVRELIACGILIKGPNGRLHANLDGQEGLAEKVSGATAGTPLPIRSIELEEALAQDILLKSLRGDGRYLREEATAASFGVGRTAIRQVFNRLAGRGLIEHVPRCGWRVRPFDEDDLRSYLVVRETLELKALDLARPRLDEADLRRMLEGNAPDGEASRLDNDLHAYLISKSGNVYIREFFDRNGAYYGCLFDFAAPETSVVETMAAQHREVLLALIARDWPRARRALAHHIQAQEPIVRELLQRLSRISSKDHQ
jgi:DNA-binding GntR family transcriptional regulator